MLADELTRREFKAYLSISHKGWTVKDLHLKPSTAIPMKRGEASSYFKVSGIQDKEYSRLNATMVERYSRPRLPHPVLEKYTHEQVLNDKGHPKYEFTDRPSGSTGILSPINLMLPYGYTPTEDGLGFAMKFPKSEGQTTRYGYYIPDKYLYSVNLTALVLSGKNNVKSYFGESLVTYEMGKIFLGIIPFKGKIDYVNTVVLGIKASLDWDKEIESLENQLIAAGVIPPRDAIEDTIVKISNPELSYTPIEELSLDEEKQSTKLPVGMTSAEQAFSD